MSLLAKLATLWLVCNAGPLEAIRGRRISSGLAEEVLCSTAELIAGILCSVGKGWVDTNMILAGTASLACG
jgi:hypothetical protein